MSPTKIQTKEINYVPPEIFDNIKIKIKLSAGY